MKLFQLRIFEVLIQALIVCPLAARGVKTLIMVSSFRAGFKGGVAEFTASEDIVFNPFILIRMVSFHITATDDKSGDIFGKHLSAIYRGIGCDQAASA